MLRLCKFFLLGVVAACTAIVAVSEDAPPAAAESATALPPLAASSYQCIGSSPANRTCLVKNAVVYDGRVWLLHNYSEPNVHITPPEVQFELNDGQPNPLSWLFERWESVSIDAMARKLQNVKVSTATQGMVWARWNWNNFYHQVGEAFPTIHYLLCLHFSDCTYNPKRAAQTLILLHDGRRTAPGNTGIEDALRCFTERPLQALSSVNTSLAWVVSGLVTGAGPRIHRFDHVGPHRTDITPETFGGYIARLHACIGVEPAAATARGTQRLRIVVVNRERSRKILNMQELVAALSSAFPTYEVVHATLDRERLQVAASMFASATVTIVPHGATMANMVFMRPGTSYVNIGLGLWNLSHAYVQWIHDSMLAAGYSVNLVKFDTAPEHLQVAVPALQRHAFWKNFSTEQRHLVVTTRTCPVGHVDCWSWALGRDIKSVTVDTEAMVRTVRSVLPQDT